MSTKSRAIKVGLGICLVLALVLLKHGSAFSQFFNRPGPMARPPVGPQPGFIFGFPPVPNSQFSSGQNNGNNGASGGSFSGGGGFSGGSFRAVAVLAGAASAGATA